MHDEPGDNDVIVILAGVRLRSGGWTSRKDAVFPGVPSVNHSRLKVLGVEAGDWMRKEYDAPGMLPARALMMNLSARLRLFHRELATVVRAEPDVLELAPERKPKARKARHK